MWNRGENDGIAGGAAASVSAGGDVSGAGMEDGKSDTTGGGGGGLQERGDRSRFLSQLLSLRSSTSTLLCSFSRPHHWQCSSDGEVGAYDGVSGSGN